MKFKFGNIRVNGSPLTYFFELSAFLFVLWMLLSGRTEGKFLIMGICFSLLTSYVCAPFLTVKNDKNGREYFLLSVNILKFAAYCLWLLKEIFTSGLEVAGTAFRKEGASPRIVYFKMDFENPAAAALLSTSITLTPGTITLDVDEEGVFQVHALTESAAEGLMTGKMQSKVASLYKETCSFVPLPHLELREIPEIME